MSCGLFTENMQEGPGSDWGDAAAAEWRFTLVEATITDRWQTNDQSAAEISYPRIDHYPVFPPSNAHFDEGSGGEKDETEKEREKESKAWGAWFLIQIHILFQGYIALREQWNTSVILIKPLNWR